LTRPLHEAALLPLLERPLTIGTKPIAIASGGEHVDSNQRSANLNGCSAEIRLSIAAAEWRWQL
jgi:hypothetical protein